jgi:nucleoside-diphosphate-sugar epimerase
VGYEILNLGGHEVISMQHLILHLEEIIGKKANIIHKPFPKADVKANQADVSKAQQLLNWRPIVELEQGLGNTVEWYLSERGWLRELTY